jgi:hypothetical protein
MASAKPCAPLATLAFFEMTTIARAFLSARCLRLTVTLGPAKRLWVKTPAAAHVESVTTNVKSSVESFTPMLATYERNPAGRVTATSRIYFLAVAVWGSIGHSLLGVDDGEPEVVSIYLDDNELVIVPTARKHGIEDADIRHAVRQPIRVFQLDELTMLIGPDRSARILEVGVVVKGEVDVVVHAMPVRAKFLR